MNRSNQSRCNSLAPESAASLPQNTAAQSPRVHSQPQLDFEPLKGSHKRTNSASNSSSACKTINGHKRTKSAGNYCCNHSYASNGSNSYAKSGLYGPQIRPQIFASDLNVHDDRGAGFMNGSCNEFRREAGNNSAIFAVDTFQAASSAVTGKN